MMEITSWVASAILIFSYFMLATGRFKQDWFIYHAMNCVGSVLFIVYSYSIGAHASIFINCVFACIAVYSIIKITLRR